MLYSQIKAGHYEYGRTLKDLNLHTSKYFLANKKYFFSKWAKNSFSKTNMLESILANVSSMLSTFTFVYQEGFKLVRQMNAF